MMSIDGVTKLVVLKLLTPDDNSPEDIAVLSSGEFYFHWYDWANNDRLVTGIRITKKIPRSDQKLNITRIASINRDGTGFVDFPMTANEYGVYRQNANIVSWLEHDPEHVLAALDDTPEGFHEPDVDLVNIYTGKKRRVLRNFFNVFDWIADRDGRIRIGVKYDQYGGRIKAKVYYRETEDDKWEVIQKGDMTDYDTWFPERFDKHESHILLVSSTALEEAHRETENSASLFRYDLRSRKILGPYVNKERNALLTLVRRGMPGKKVRIASQDATKNRTIFKVFDDTLPPVYYLLDKKLNYFTLVGGAYLDLMDLEMSPMESVSYTARDGLEIPAFLTLPVNRPKTQLPLILFPHGGPHARDTFGFNNYVQFFANRGYAVLQPQFRGSTGEGVAFEEAGYGEWGLKMQDDLTDGVKWLIERGTVDPKRVCVVGASYGGYAASMALIKTPELFQCAVSINGVQDLRKLIDSTDYHLFGNSTKKILNDKKIAKETSPYHQADKITKPLLLLASENDTVVDMNQHSKRLYKKLKRNGAPVTFVPMEKGEHWRTNEANQLIIFAEMETFLARHLSPTVSEINTAQAKQ